MFDFRNWNWDKIDEIVASMARPYQQYACSTAVAFSTVWSIIVHADAIIVGACMTACAGLAGNAAILRTVDKKTAAAADVAKTTGATSSAP